MSEVSGNVVTIRLSLKLRPLKDCSLIRLVRGFEHNGRLKGSYATKSSTIPLLPPKRRGAGYFVTQRRLPRSKAQTPQQPQKARVPLGRKADLSKTRG